MNNITKQIGKNLLKIILFWAMLVAEILVSTAFYAGLILYGIPADTSLLISSIFTVILVLISMALTFDLFPILKGIFKRISSNLSHLRPMNNHTVEVQNSLVNLLLSQNLSFLSNPNIDKAREIYPVFEQLITSQTDMAQKINKLAETIQNQNVQWKKALEENLTITAEKQQKDFNHLLDDWIKKQSATQSQILDLLIKQGESMDQQKQDTQDLKKEGVDILSVSNKENIPSTIYFYKTKREATPDSSIVRSLQSFLHKDSQSFKASFFLAHKSADLWTPNISSLIAPNNTFLLQYILSNKFLSEASLFPILLSLPSEERTLFLKRLSPDERQALLTKLSEELVQ